ncbi:hypothetical protein LOZ55_000081 [Ophidiomyces ophidiicola]|nr:hypothetical protein LOZ55_000081 [Ophidiomyces ophidiicola]
MISIQHACLPSVLAYAAATTLPPSPTDSPTACGTPSSPLLGLNLSTPLPSTSADQTAVAGPRHGPKPLPASESPSGSAAGLAQLNPQTVYPSTRTDKVGVDAPSNSPLGSRSHPKVSFVQFSRQFQLQRHQTVQRRAVLRRLWDLRVAVALSVRLLRVAATVQKGLVENFKQGDKSGFISIYNTIHDIRDLCDSFARHHAQSHDDLSAVAVDSPTRTYPSTFTHRLTSRSRDDLLNILARVRTDSDFLFQCIGSLTPAQLSALVSPAHTVNVGDVSSPLGFRNRPASLFARRAGSHSTAFKEHAFAFERTDPLSALLFNVFAAPLASNSPEAQLRLDVWSSTCAKLISYGGSSHYSFIGQILSLWSGATEWKAKPKFEIYLMDILQKGAFLLGNLDSRRLGSETDSSDLFKTDLAKHFFQSAIHDLFVVLDDCDAGLPVGAIELGNAILQKITTPDSRKRFLDFLFFQWFFRKFLPNALCYPESHGLLLDFHITKDARDRILAQISHRSQVYVSRILHTQPQFTLALPDIKLRIENMLSRFNHSVFTPPSDGKYYTAASNCSSSCDEPENLLTLSSTDITTILDALFPRPVQPSNVLDPFQHLSVPSSPPNSVSPRNDYRGFEPGLFQGRVDTVSSHSLTAKTAFTTEMSFHEPTTSYFTPPSSTASPISPQESLSRNADRIRYELSEINESEDRHSLVSPASEDWALVSISNDGRKLHFLEDNPASTDKAISPSTKLSDKDHSILQTAIFHLIDDCDLSSDTISMESLSAVRPNPERESALKRRFIDAMTYCQRQSDFTTALYWWDACRVLRNVDGGKPTSSTDDKILSPMYLAAKHSTDADTSTIQQCSQKMIGLQQTLRHLQNQVKASMGSLRRLRNKMWYMTDVKNSLRYEDARNVALALKSMMGFQAAPEPKPGNGMRSLGGSFLQKPEVHVMNVMKASGSQGGPTKLSDEQVDITRRWLHRSGIDNFCRGEERIHRFCYEVKTSVSKLVGETMYDSPVLWASELYQKERSMFEGPSTRPLTAVSGGMNIRPSSIASDESLYPYPAQGNGSRTIDSLFRGPSYAPSLEHKLSYQSINSERCRTSGADTSSMDDSPGRATSTVESYQAFWSPPHTQAQSTTSISSFQSRPGSTISDVLTTRKLERSPPGKAAFLDELKQTLTSLLLSDLGSPVWSCGSETDAWFSDYLSQPRISSQVANREMQGRFFAELSAPVDPCTNETHFTLPGKGLRRCRSAVALSSKYREASNSLVKNKEPEKSDQNSDFEYDMAFRQLMDKFSRPANPFTKLKALNDLRALVVASLMSVGRDSEPGNGKEPAIISNNMRHQRNSVSGRSKPLDKFDDQTPTPSSPAPAFNDIFDDPSLDLQPTDGQIIRALRNIIQRYRPKTLFRDLQFIAAFVPSEVLNKLDAGTAFLQFGLAAFELKDDVCHSMVEIADKIVSQELSKRQRHSNSPSHLGSGIEDAAKMWVTTAKEGNAVAQRELAILYLTHPEILPRATLPLTMPRDTFKAEMMYRRDLDSKSDPQSMCLALHWMQLSAAGGDKLAQNRLRERDEFESLA